MVFPSSSITRKLSLLIAATALLLGSSMTSAFAQEVVVDVISPGDGPAVTKEFRYSSMVTLYIENSDKTKTPSGWSTRKEDGADRDQPFTFQPGVNLITGWTEGVMLKYRACRRPVGAI